MLCVCRLLTDPLLPKVTDLPMLRKSLKEKMGKAQRILPIKMSI